MKKMTQSAKRILNKSLRREVEILDLYLLTQTELFPLLYTTVKGSTNQNLIAKQVFCHVTPGYTSILNITSDIVLEFP